MVAVCGKSCMNELTILCKVVDNFGDAGVVLRLARAMCALEPSLCLRIITDNRKLFCMLQGDDLSASMGLSAGGCISASADNITRHSRVRFFDWDDSDGKCVREFSENLPNVILECFACGRPDWLEKLLFDDGSASGSYSASAGQSASDCVCANGRASTSTRLTHIVNVEFLTAEDYADEFHLIKSGTRSPHVKKSIFMPGFTQKTGGLILDGIFSEAEKSKVLPKNILHLRNNDKSSDIFNILVFTYDRKIVSLVFALSHFKNLNVHVARGVGFAPFIDAWENSGKPFAVSELPFLPQTKWDEFLATCDFLFVRGEDSVSRACLSGVPFVWQAYVQEDDYHLVKVNALLERMKPHFSEEDFTLVSAVWRAFNVSADTPASDAACASETTSSCEHSESDSKSLAHSESDLIFAMLIKASTLENSLVKGFESFAKSLYENGDAAKHLLAYIQTFH